MIGISYYLIPQKTVALMIFLGLRNSFHIFLGQLRVMAAPWMLGELVWDAAK